MGRSIRKEVTVEAPVKEVWEVWTTEEGVKTFFAPKARVDLSIGGSYEMLFNPDAPAGSQGGEGLRIQSYSPEEMLSFEWNAPPEYPAVRQDRTWVVLLFAAVPGSRTRVTLTHLGWKSSEEWDTVFGYFMRAWDVVLGRLAHRFSVGPIDWDEPFRPDTQQPTAHDPQLNDKGNAI